MRSQSAKSECVCFLFEINHITLLNRVSADAVHVDKSVSGCVAMA